ncbi:hypothetical protein Ancab_034348 [Ancistrocladus abbreviatus]
MKSFIDRTWPPEIPLGEVNKKLIRGLTGCELARFKFRKGCITFYVYAVRRQGTVGFACADDLRTILQSVVALKDFLDHTAMLAMPKLFGGVALLLFVALFWIIFFEARGSRFNNASVKTSLHVEGQASFEDPNSFKQVPCPSIFDPAEKYLSLIIPAFNEEHRLPGALDETMNYLQKHAEKDKSFSYEVLIVDDGSVDETKRVAFNFVKKHTVDNVRVILLGRNHGKGEAIRKGMLHSRGELLLMLDADGATKVNDLEKLERQIHAVARKEFHFEDAAASDANLRISDYPIAAFGSRAHLEEKALATVSWQLRVFILSSPPRFNANRISFCSSAKMVPKLFDERFPSCGSHGSWSWNP